MLIRVDGRHDGVKQYLEDGQKRGRELERDELDERVPLAGDLDLTDSIIQSIDADPGVDRYLTITLSFKEDHVDRETLDAVVRDFEAFAFAAHRPDEYNFYAEAHLPRVKSYQDSKTGQLVERKPHIHIVIPKVNLISGQHMEPLGYVKSNIRFIDAFQEATNARYGLESPKDNRRVTLTDASEMISRYKGDIFGLSSRALKEQLLDTVLDRRIERHEDFMAMLAEHGETRMRNAGRENAYPNVKLPGEAKGVNLKEHVFSREFIELPTDEKLLQLSADITPVYESAGSPREPSAVQVATLAEWQQFRAREVKYVRNGNTHAVPAYHEATPEDRLRQLDNRERLFYQRFDPHHARNHHEPRAGEQRAHPVNTFDEAEQRLRRIDRVYGFKRTELAGIDGRFAHGTAPGYERFITGDAPDAPHAGHHRGRRDAGQSGRFDGGRFNAGRFGSNSPDRWQYGAVPGRPRATSPAVDGVRGVPGVPVVSVPARPAVLLPDHAHRVVEQQQSVSPDRVRRDRHRERTAVRATGRIADSALSQRMRDARETQQQGRDSQQSEFATIRQRLDAHRLLAELSHTHGVRPEKYRVTKGRDGGDRIRCGARRLNVSDFLTKELNQAWRDAAPMLRQVYGRQSAGLPAPQPRELPRAALWRDFAADREIRNDERRAAWQAQREHERARRDEIHRAFATSRDALRSDPALRPSERRAALSVARMTRADELMALQKTIEAERDTLKARHGHVGHTFADYLTTRAQGGDEAALAELRRVQPDARTDGLEDERETTNEIRPVIPTARNEILFRAPALTWEVHRNGDVTYRHDGLDVIRDQGKTVRVLDTSPEAIEAALRLAQAKYGNTLELSGSVEYQLAAARVAADAGLYVQFTDEQLNRAMTERRQENVQQRAAGAAGVASRASTGPRTPDQSTTARGLADAGNDAPEQGPTR